MRCREMGYADQNIYIDTLFTDNGTLSKVDASAYKTFETAERAFSMFSYSLSERDYVYAREDYPHVNFRYTVMPSQTLPSGLFPLLFDNEKMNECIQIGIKDGQNIVNAGEGVVSDQIYQKIKGKFGSEATHEFYRLGEDRNEAVEVVSL